MSSGGGGGAGADGGGGGGGNDRRRRSSASSGSSSSSRRRRQQRSDSRSGSGASGRQAAPTNVLYIYRYQDGKKQWTRRYVQLRGTRFMYGSKPDKMTRYMMVHGVEAEGEDGMCQFKLSASYPEFLNLHLQANSEADKRAWISAVERAVSRAEEVDQMMASQRAAPRSPVDAAVAARYVKVLALLRFLKRTRHLQQLMDASLDDAALPEATPAQLEAAGLPVTSRGAIRETLRKKPEVFHESSLQQHDVVNALSAELMSKYASQQVTAAQPLPALQQDADTPVPDDVAQCLKRLGRKEVPELDALEASDALLTVLYMQDKDKSKRRAVAVHFDIVVNAYKQHSKNASVCENLLRTATVCALHQDENKVPMMKAGAVEMAASSCYHFSSAGTDSPDYDVLLWASLLLTMLSHMRSAQASIAASKAEAGMRAAAKDFPDSDFIPFNVESFLENLKDESNWR